MTKENAQQENKRRGKGSWIWIIWIIIWWTTVISTIKSIHGTVDWKISITLIVCSLFLAFFAWRAIRYHRGFVSFTAGDYEKADRIFEGLATNLLIGRRFAEICHTNLTFTKFLLGDYVNAIRFGQKALKSRRLSPAYRKAVLVYLYASLIRIGRQDATSKIVEEIEQLPKDPKADSVYGVTKAYQCILANRPAEALAHIETVADCEASVSSCTFNAAMAYALKALGRNTEAQPYIEKVKQSPKAKVDLCYRLYPQLASILSEAGVTEGSRHA